MTLSERQQKEFAYKNKKGDAIDERIGTLILQKVRLFILFIFILCYKTNLKSINRESQFYNLKYSLKKNVFDNNNSK